MSLIDKYDQLFYLNRELLPFISSSQTHGSDPNEERDGVTKGSLEDRFRKKE